MTPGEFAVVVGADAKWIRNARRTLLRPTGTDEASARWLGLVHELHVSLGIGLREAARMADVALAADGALTTVEVAANRADTVTLVIDLVRARSLHALRYARALHLPALDQRGRPATGYRPLVEALKRRARRDDDVRALRVSARRTPAERLAALGPLADILGGLADAGVRFVVVGEMAAALFGALRHPSSVDVIHHVGDETSLHSLAKFLRGCAAAPRGSARSENPNLDARLLGAAGTLALATPREALNLLVELIPIGDYAAALDAAVDEFGFPVLGLPAQMAVQRHEGRTINAELLFELQELERERQREAWRLSRRVSRP